MSTLDLDHLRGCIGNEQHVTDHVTESLAYRYHATFDMPGQPPDHGKIVPRLIHFCIAQVAEPTTRLGADGHPKRGGFLPPVELPRRMWAGGELLFHGDLRVGDTVHRISRIEDIAMKQGRSGMLCFVTVSHRIEVAGAVMIDERQDIVYRGSAQSVAAQPVHMKDEMGDHRRILVVEAPLLFRYSALTFNSHRIHYDRSYATEVEGYAGLVVHGPMQAALLMNYACQIRGHAPARFSYRGQSPLFDGEPFTLNASEENGMMKLWSARTDGHLCMAAEASWI